MNIKNITNVRTWVIAEIGINHEGSVERCLELVNSAGLAGADAVKLQTITPQLNYAKDTESYKLFSKATLSLQDTAKVFDYIRERKMSPFTTVGDLQTLSEIRKLDPVCFKISSGLLTCTPLIKTLALYKTPVILSTGMSDIQDTTDAIQALEPLGDDMYALLHCVSLYPPAHNELNLSQINFLQKRFNCTVGYSDHSGDHRISSIAVAAGAKIIEAHITFDKNRPSFDHKISLEPADFAKMVTKIRRVETIMGVSGETRSQKIRDVGKAMGRYISTITPIKKGERISENNTGFLRFCQSEDLVPAKFLSEFIGKKAARDIDAFEPIKLVDVKDEK